MRSVPNHNLGDLEVPLVDPPVLVDASHQGRTPVPVPAELEALCGVSTWNNLSGIRDTHRLL